MTMTSNNHERRDDVVFTTIQVVHLTGIHPRTLDAFARAGIVHPGQDIGQPVYGRADVARLCQARNMVQHAGIPVAQVASIFALRDQIDQTRRELDHLVGQLWAELDSAMPTPSGRVFTTGADGQVWVGRHRPGARRRLSR
ncbi:HspR, transcriptional repressor of DnaK operon [Luteococcus japonicus LSP_Lj1]|uniref:HspR, transcriptional repressor of DnaK operon n=2 Tax=Luteococcus japonicus TaxID=33984 RepID=A0A1R4JQ44_9ACTN|nr:HspR, transcriptional repressor of DnaK operon [Luteococcus japonicus LSP_Lj1]